MDEQLKNKIIENIYSSGFFSELKILSIFKKNDWDRQPNKSFIDKDSGKSREIDLIATKVFGDDKVILEINLVIEVKKSNKNHWVIFTSDFHKHALLSLPGFRIIKYFDNYNKKNLTSNELMTAYPRNTESRIGTSFHEFNKKPNEKSQIYDALIKACKAAFYEKELNNPSLA